MNEHRTRRRLLQVAGTATVAGLAGCSSSEGRTIPERPATVQVRIENVAPTDYYASDSSTGGGIWFSAGAYTLQDSYDHKISSRRAIEGPAASTALEALAEAGDPTGFEGEPGLVDELDSYTEGYEADTFGADDIVGEPDDPSSVPDGPHIAPGQAFEFTVEADPGNPLSLATKLIPSNDIFLAPDLYFEPWPWGGEPPLDADLTERLTLWDAGTEPNQQPGFGADQLPSQQSPDQGADEGAVIRKLSEVDDGYDYPAVEDIIKLELTPQPP